MKDHYVDLLKEEMNALGLASDALKFSISKCEHFLDNSHHSQLELESIEALTSRFSRLGDILVQKVFRVIDEIELENEGTVRDRINRAEKRGLIESADIFIEIRRIRNRIAHEYVPNAAEKFFNKTFQLSQALLNSVNRVNTFCQKKYNLI